MPLLRSVPRGPRALVVPLALFFALISSATALAAGPKITKVTPLKIEVGQQIVINGKGFIPGRNKNTVVFKRDGSPAVFAKADKATSTRISLVVPAKLTTFLTAKDGTAGVYRFRLRILAKRFGDAFTSTKLSPKIGQPGAFGGAPDASGGADCDKDKIVNSLDPDDDNDGLTDVQEKTYGTDACKVDTDGDGVSDTFEIESALDLNSRALPFPGKRPYPNALDGTDANVDFDQDGMTMIQEYNLWQYTTGGKLPLTYSDGDQDTNVDGSDTVVPAGLEYLDMNHDGLLTDDEKDGDHDGLGNWDEANGAMLQAWWPQQYPTEVPYSGSPLSGVNYVDPDSDGDGVLDGADDQDHDGWSNADEMDRYHDWGGGKHYLVNPYNPCLPDPTSRVCTLHPPFTGAWAPFPLDPTLPIPLTWTPPNPVTPPAP